MNISAATKDKDGHSLVKLWEAYYKAVSADKPKDQLKALDKIKDKAREQKLAWDYYDACDRYVGARSSTNWKMRRSAEEDRDREIRGFGEPVAVYFLDRERKSDDELYEYVRQNATALRKSHNPEFYSRDYRFNSQIYSEVLAELIGNDYEYVLWSLFHKGCKPAQEQLGTLVGTRYPQNAFMEYTLAGRKDSEDENLTATKAFAEKHKGRAVALFARQDLLQDRFRRLTSKPGTAEQDYIALSSDCNTFIADQKRFSADIDKKIASRCTDPAELLKDLNAKDIAFSVENGVLSLMMRNLASAQVSVTKGKESVFSRKVENKDRRFYIFDTLTVKLPEMNDGDYHIVCSSGKVRSENDYQKYSLSIAMKRDRDGYAVYVADYISGRPVEKCDIISYDNGKQTAVASGLAIDGYTYLPESMVRKFGTRRYDLAVQARLTGRDGRTRLSRMHRFGSSELRETPAAEGKGEVRAVTISDRSAFRPGEKIQFKTVVYSGRFGLDIVPGAGITAELHDTRDKVVSYIDLTTNEFGSAAGEFTLPEGERGGIFSIYIKQGRSNLGRHNFRVDEFVLPTFELIWEDDDDRLYLPGDEIKVKGLVKAYSGHSLNSATIAYSINSEAEQTLRPGADGSFAISFKTDTGGSNFKYYNITVKVTDATGETLEFSTSRRCASRLNLSADILNACSGSVALADESSVSIISDDRLELRYAAQFFYNEGGYPDASISYRLSDEGGRTVSEGRTYKLGKHIVSLAGLPSGLYTLDSRLTATSEDGKAYEAEHSLKFVIAHDSDKALNFDALCFFKEVKGDGIALLTGTTDGTMWLVSELYGDGNRLLDKRLITLQGEKGKDGSTAVAGFDIREDYPEELHLHVIGFKNGRKYEYNMYKTVEKPESRLPLEFTKFLDTTVPGHKYQFLIKTAAGTECAASVFDASSETIMGNMWYAVRPLAAPVQSVSFSSSCGLDRSGYMMYDLYARRTRLTKSAVMLNASTDMVMEEMEMDAVPMLAGAAAGVVPEAAEEMSEDGAAVKVREDFGATVAWEPFLRSDKDGVITFDFTTGDKLSKYYVQLFAHDKQMNSSVLRREMLVTLPVKIAVVQPQCLYGGDRYVVRVTLSNMFGTALKGRIEAKFYNGRERSEGTLISSKSTAVSIEGNGSAQAGFELGIPAGISELGMLLAFVPEGDSFGSDAVFVSVPVKAALQTITEAHSALMGAGDGRDAIIARLRKEFVNSDGGKAEVREISILDMLGEAIPERVLPASDNLMDLSEALYANILLGRLPEQYRKAGADKAQMAEMAEMAEKIRACANLDGGFAWFAGMASSPTMTAAVLERFAAMGKDIPAELAALIPAAVKYLDSAELGSQKRPYWCWISLEQYLHVRAMFPEVEFEYSGSTSDKVFTRFRKDVNEYLVPSGARHLNGQVFAKARRLQTLRALNASKEGRELAHSLGIGGAVSSKIEKSIAKDVESLLQYAEPHRSGGMYYPNAVMPWRGLLESELYAHTQLCNLLSDCGHSDVAEGIRLWIMVQKETQNWGTDASYIEALGAVLAGSEATLGTRVIALSATSTLPFAKIKAGGNGMSVNLVFTRDGKELKDGDILHVGDRITGEYRIWNEENRSFVRLTAPRNAALRPVQQLSGHIGWWMRPLTISGYVAFSPQGYRSVYDDRTEFWFDSYPEETTTVTEEYFVTQEGSFQSPVPVIESVYAPHYRANAGGREAVTVK